MTLVYPGSFDPVTLGHIDMVYRGKKLADKLIVAVLDNPNKNSLFTVSERIDLLKSIFHDDIVVDSFSGLLADYVKLNKVDGILRGLRTEADFGTESQYAINNKLLSDGVETIFLTANPSLSFISSSIVREIAAFSNGQRLEGMVTSLVQERIVNKLKIQAEG